jgi:excinuclease ABC subunit C
MSSIDHKLAQLPANPGVYLFKDEKGTTVYVGKAGNIKHRVTSYFQRAADKDSKTLAMVEKVADIETIVTDTEKEAFILEDNLIKAHHPRYNIKLRDDKNYPCLRLSVEEEFPTLCIVRRIKKDRSLYFGPYPSATSLRETLRMVRRLFPIRTCVDTKFTHRLRPCVNYEMGRCGGPCCGNMDAAQYREVVRQVRLFLEGKDRELLERLKAKMDAESGQLHFEAAARTRDQIEHIEKVIEKQKVVSRDFIDQDVIGFYRHDHAAIIHPLFIRAGRLQGGKGFAVLLSGLPDEELLSSFLRQYYQEGRFIPEQILIPAALPEEASLEQWLSEKRGKRVRLWVPSRGDKKHLLDMACENAEKFLRADAELKRDQERVLQLLREKLHLRKDPHKIEAFDISNFQGGYAVGSMVTFEEGKPRKEGYRHFKIRTVEGADDYAMMYEVLLRRYRRAVEENDIPDLILLDGGRGQLNVAQEVLSELGIEGSDLISLAKERTIEGPRALPFRKTEEKVFHPQFKDPFLFERHSPLLHLLDRIRDEAHRFAVSYHTRLRGKETLKSVIREIPGIGKARQKELLRHFGSVEKIKDADIQTLALAPKMNTKLAREIYAFFHPGTSADLPRDPQEVGPSGRVET